MADPTRISPLDAVPLGDDAPDAPGVRLIRRPPPTVWRITAWPGRAQAVAKALASRDAYRAGALKWDVFETPPEIGSEDGSAVDLSAGKAMIGVEGPAARALLARFTSIDTRSAALSVGAYAATGAPHTPFSLIRRDVHSFDILVDRSFARHLWEGLVHHARQFGSETV